MILTAPLAVLLAAAMPTPATGAAKGAAPAGNATGFGVDPADAGSLAAITRIVGAQKAWAAGLTGKGVDVAVIDTGVARVPGLDRAGQVIDGPDLSFDAATGGPPGVDAFGHGTFMAGIIAGRDAGVSASAAGCTTCLNQSGFSTTAAYVGVAPESRIVNVKVGAADGAADVTQVIAAVNWVTQHARDPGLNIRVLSLSYGADSAQPYTLDPLAFAVEQAWRRGILVVASAGNEGRSVKSLADPAYDPHVVAVGGLDPRGSISAADDKVATFAQHGTPERPVDVVAPAVSVVGLRVPGSFVDLNSANRGRFGDRFQRGSGTSQAAAVVSGVAALLAQRYPRATPDQLKALLNATGSALTNGNTSADDPRTLVYSGHGTVNTANALDATLPSVASSTQNFAPGTGTGTLDATRNGVFVTAEGVALTGQRDVFGEHYDSAAMAALQASATAWTGGIWNGNRWTGDTWTGSRWGSTVWEGSRWDAVSWTGSRWGSGTWTGSRWGSGTWDGSRWGSGTWDGSRWGSGTWDGSRWGSGSWTTGQWSSSLGE